jgi:hypothetical protein
MFSCHQLDIGLYLVNTKNIWYHGTDKIRDKIRDKMPNAQRADVICIEAQTSLAWIEHKSAWTWLYARHILRIYTPITALFKHCTNFNQHSPYCEHMKRLNALAYRICICSVRRWLKILCFPKDSDFSIYGLQLTMRVRESLESKNYSAKQTYR